MLSGGGGALSLCVYALLTNEMEFMQKLQVTRFDSDTTSITMHQNVRKQTITM